MFDDGNTRLLQVGSIRPRGACALCQTYRRSLLKQLQQTRIEKAGGPSRRRTGPSAQPIAGVFFRSYGGSGLLSKSLARLQFVPKPLSARRTLSSETSLGLRACSKLAWAASSTSLGAGGCQGEEQAKPQATFPEPCNVTNES